MRHSNRRWKGRARSAPAANLFEQALLGDLASRNQDSDRRTDRKTLQLCRQIHRTLIMAVGAELPGNVSVESVEPMGGASQLLVRIVVHDATPTAIGDAMNQLNERAGALRALVSRSIHRKRAPSLHFIPIPRAAEAENGGRP